MAKRRGAGSLIGVVNTPSQLSAGGIWSLNEILRARAASIWPFAYIFQTAASAVGNGDTDGQTNRNFRQIIANANLANLPAVAVRVTFTAGAAGDNFGIDAAAIGLKAGSGDAYDFAGTPVALTFAGAPGFDIAAGQSITSDPAVLAIGGSDSLVIAYHTLNNAAKDQVRSKSTATTGWSVYFKDGASDVTTVNASGYTDLTASFKAMGISLVEVSS